MNPYEVIKALESVSGSTEKKRLLIEHDSPRLRDIIQATLDPFAVYGVKKYEFGEPCEHNEDFEWNIKFLFALLADLSTRKVTGNKALEAIKATSETLSVEQQYCLKCILDKDLHCGVAVKTVNSVYKGLVRTFDVMLAKPSVSKKIKYPCLVEQKLDGVRCISMLNAGNVKYYSRNGKEFTNFGMFDKELLAIAGRYGSVVFDGEVTGLSNKDAFKGVTQQARRMYDVNTTELRYHLFDVLLKGSSFIKKKESKPQEERSAFLRTLFITEEALCRETCNVKKVKGKICTDIKGVEKFYQKCISNGYEGVIVKDLTSLYEYKRSLAWGKIKPVETLDLECIAVEEGRGKYKGVLGALIVNNKGVEVNVGSGFSDKQRKQFWKMAKKDKMVGLIIEVKYDSITSDGSLRFPRFCQIRLDKD